MATLLEEQAIVMSHPQGTSNKENFLLLIREPHSHILPGLRKASWHNYEGNLKEGQGSRILVREIRVENYVFLRLLL